MKDLKKRAAITGASTVELTKLITDKTTIRIMVEAAMEAIEDAGLQKHDIDGIITSEGGGASGNPRAHIELSEYMGIFDKALCVSLPVGGATPGLSMVLAQWAIDSGRCKNVLIVAGGASMAKYGRGASGHGFTDFLASFSGHSPSYEQPFGPLMISYYAVVAQRHMYEYGTTPEQLAAVAVAARRHASLNPEAIMRHPITVEDVLSSRMITTPFHLLDCCITTDGAAALVMTSYDNARACRKPPVWVLGLGHSSSSYFMGDLARPHPGKGLSLTSTVGRFAGNDAFQEAGVERSDIDFVELYDNFTISPIIQLEDFGFCAKGEGGPFVEGGRVELGGELPLNTHGGLLSCAFTPAGYLHWVEAVRQLRGEAGDRQVPEAKLGLVCSVAGVLSTYGGVGILARD